MWPGSAILRWFGLRDLDWSLVGDRLAAGQADGIIFVNGMPIGTRPRRGLREAADLEQAMLARYGSGSGSSGPGGLSGATETG